MGNSYRGQATILYDGKEVDVYARLVKTVSNGMESWSGQLDAQSEDADLWDVFQTDPKQIRTPEGVGDFISTNYKLGEDSLNILGSGPAPF